MSKKSSLEDERLVKAYSKFVSKFECAANMIKSKGYSVSNVIDYSMLETYRRAPYKGMIKVFAPQHLPGYWHLAKDKVHTAIHPFILMLDEKRNITANIEQDIEILFGFEQTTIEASFNQGFRYEPSYMDVWSDDGYHWGMGAAFHVGRYFLDKYIGRKLPYKIPTILKTRGIIKC
jgi:hypothetical protein